MLYSPVLKATRSLYSLRFDSSHGNADAGVTMTTDRGNYFYTNRSCIYIYYVTISACLVTGNLGSVNWLPTSHELL